MKQIDEELSQVIDEILLKCREAISDYLNGRDKSLNYILGKSYKKTNKNIDPIKTKQLLLKKLEVK